MKNEDENVKTKLSSKAKIETNNFFLKKLKRKLENCRTVEL